MQYKSLESEEEGTFLFENRILCDNSLQVSDPLQNKKSKNHLLSVSSVLGLIACGTHDGVVLVPTRDVHKYFVKEEMGKVRIREGKRVLPTDEIPTFVSFSTDNTYLAIAHGINVEFYPTKGILKGSKPIRHTIGSTTNTLSWKTTSTVAVVDSSDRMTILRIDGTKIEVIYSAEGICSGTLNNFF